MHSPSAWGSEVTTPQDIVTSQEKEWGGVNLPEPPPKVGQSLKGSNVHPLVLHPGQVLLRL